jgi:hypothetical protein
MGGGRLRRATLALALTGGLMLAVGQAPSAAQDSPSPTNSTITLSNDPAVLTGQPGSGSFSATVTFEDSSGDPVANEQVIMTVEDTTSHDNMSTGVPNNGQEFTDDSGQATYAISCATLGCSPGDQLQIGAADGSDVEVAGPVSESVGEVDLAETTGYVGQSNTLLVEDLTGTATENQPVSLTLAGTPITLSSCTTDGTGSLPAAGSPGACDFTIPTLPGISPPQNIAAVVTVGSQNFDTSLQLLSGDPSSANSTISLSPDQFIISGSNFLVSFTATVTVEDASGDPIAGDVISLATQPDFGGEAAVSPQSTNSSGVATFLWTCPNGYCNPGQTIGVTASDSLGLLVGPVDENVSEIEFAGSNYTGATDTLLIDDLPGLANADQPVSLSLNSSSVSLSGDCTTNTTGSLPTVYAPNPCTFTVPVMPGVTPPASVAAVITVGAQVFNETFTLAASPALTLSTPSGLGGSTLVVNGTGFSADSPVNVEFTPDGATAAAVSAQCSTNGFGTIINDSGISCTLAIPANSAVGAGTVSALNYPTATATFTVEPPVMTGIAISSAGFPAEVGVPGVELYLGDNYDLTIQADYSDGSVVPLVVPNGSPDPVVTMSTQPVPSGAITFSYSSGDLIGVAANTVTTSPAIIEAAYDGFIAYSYSLNGAVLSCGDCYFVNGALLNVQAQVPGPLGIGSTPVAGAMADITQGVGKTGAYTVDDPCYPFSSNGEEGCGSPPSGDPLTASTTSCATDGTGSCPLTAMWDPDAITLTPPPGYTITGVSGCDSVAGPSNAPVCNLTPADWSNPLTITFQLAPPASLTVDVSGGGGDSVGATVSLPGAPAEPSWWQASDQGDWPPTCTTTALGNNESSCTFQDLPEGTFTVGVDLSTAIYETGAPLYSTASDVQQANQSGVVLNSGENSPVTFDVDFAPTLTVAVNGFDSDNSTVTLSPSGVSEPSWWSVLSDGAWPPTCTTEMVADPGQTSCTFANLPPGEFTVGVDLSTGAYDLAFPLYLTSNNSQQGSQIEALVPGANPTVNFSAGLAPSFSYTIDSVGLGAAAAGATINLGPPTGVTEPTWWPSSNQGAWPPTCITTQVDVNKASCSFGMLPPGLWSIEADLSTATGLGGLPLYPTSEGELQQYVDAAQLNAGDLSDAGSFEVATAPNPLVTISGVLGGYSAGTSVEFFPESGETEPSWWSDSNSGAWPPTCTTEEVVGNPNESDCGITSVPPGTWAVSIDTQTAAIAQSFPLYVSGTDFSVGDQNSLVFKPGDNPPINFNTDIPTLTSYGEGPMSATDGSLSATGTGGTGNVTVGEYSGDPENNPLAFASGNNYFDTYLPPQDTFTSLTLSECGVPADSSMGWFDPYADSDSGSWEPVVGDPGPTYANGCLNVTFNNLKDPNTGNNLTSPTLSQLDGTVFGVNIPAPPKANINAPASAGPYALGQSVPTRFTCADSAWGPGISSCADSNGATAGVGALSTSTAGTHTYTVLATSIDGQTAKSSLSYSVQAAPPPASGYDLAGSDGGVFVFPTGQSAGFFGSLPGMGVNVNNIVGIVPTNNDRGYDLVGSDGGVFVFPTGQSAGFFGSLPGMGVNVNNIVGIVPTNNDQGYDLVGSDGGVFVFPTGQSAGFFGSLPGVGVNVNNIVGIVATPGGGGYFLVGKDGGVFTFGNAPFLGSLPGIGVRVNDVAGITATPDGKGYYVVGADGSVYAFGTAANYGSLPALGVSVSNIVSIVPTPTGLGYWLIGRDGGVFAFGDATNQGSLPSIGVHVDNVIGAVPTG